MTTAKRTWGTKPESNQTNLRFCCPHCTEWIRNTEFETHINLVHPEVKILPFKKTPPLMH